ncbi:MAG: Hsp70 family protein, partial [Bacteroidia bacterium]|nr:Hsp70 family protein [Bacteroidia bacterium]
LSPRDLQFVLMVGGSTFIPYVRRRVEEVLQVRVNTEIDPTTAVAVGAAYYAGSKPKESDSTAAARKPSALRFKCVYEKATREPEVYFAAKIVEGDPKGLFYKITRLDGGFDTGLKPLSKDFSEDLPLMPNEYNYFKLTIFDAQNNVVETGLDLIGVAHGKFSIAAQPLPNDICLEVDDVETGGSRSELVFAKNTGLPVRKTLTKTLNKTIVKGSDECLHINVLEGSHQSLPEANLVIGHLQITGKQLSRDVARGSDIEITIEISESRDVTIGAYLNMSDQSFSQIFNPKERHVPVEFLKKEIRDMLKKIENEISLAEEREDYEMLKELRPVLSQIKELHSESLRLASDDVTDARYQLDDKKRKIAQEFDNATKTKRLSEAKAEYEEIKRRCQTALKEGGNDYERKIFQEIVAQERVFLASGGATKIREKIDELHGLCIQILRRQPEFLIALFKHLTENTRRMNDREQADLLAQAGFSAIHAKDWERLDHVNSALISLLPNSARQDLATKIGFA